MFARSGNSSSEPLCQSPHCSLRTGMKICCVIFLLLLHVVSSEDVTRIRSTCLIPVPVHPFNGTGCGTPITVDLDTFGDNARSSGVFRAVNRGRELRVAIRLRDLPRPDLVLTSWILWALPGPENPRVFDIANIDSPLASTTAGYTSGLGREPNQFRYTSETTAQLIVRLNFNPSYPREGPLTGKRFCFQKDIPGIEDTALRQPPVSEGVFTPVGNHFLRRYDDSGFERLNRRGRPNLVRSPVGAIAVIVAVHIDQTTHGVTAGNFLADHYELLSFIFDGPFGERIVSH